MPKSLLAGLAFIAGIFVSGLVLSHQGHEVFLLWIHEDGLVEWLTFGELLIMSAFSFVMSHAFRRSGQGRAASRVWLLLGFLCLFGAIEEISWGQRVFGIESPKWFRKHNAQGETNLHNLVFYGVKINKLVFGTILGVLVVIYLSLFPVLYRLSGRFKGFIDRWGIPIAQNYQIAIAVIVFILVQLHLDFSKKVRELLELYTCFLFLLVLAHPYNQEAFPLRWLQFRRRKASRGEQAGRQ